MIFKQRILYKKNLTGAVVSFDRTILLAYEFIGQGRMVLKKNVGPMIRLISRRFSNI